MSFLSPLIYSNVQKDFVTSLFTRVPYIEYYLRNAYLCGHLIVKHIQISYNDSIFFNLCNDILYDVFVSSIVQEPLSAKLPKGYQSQGPSFLLSFRSSKYLETHKESHCMVE